jgi:hypothetical protein
VFARAFDLSDRSEGISRGSYAYSIYASWFDTVAPKLRASIYRLEPVPFPIRGMPLVGGDDFVALLPEAPLPRRYSWKEAPLTPPEGRRHVVEQTVRSWTKMIAQYHSYPLESAVALLRSRSLFNKLLYTYDPLLVKLTLKHFLDHDWETSSIFLDRLVGEAVDFYDSLLYRIPVANGT